jgi:hypothetical protein
MKNGRDDHHDDPKITSLDAVRRKASAAKRAQAGGGRAPGSVKDWIVGGIIVAMALGMVVSFGGSVLQALGLVAR